MILQLLAGILVLMVLATVLRSLWVRAGLTTRQTVISVGAAVLVVGAIALAATGRLNWILAALTAIVPFARRIAGLLLSATAITRLFPQLAARMGRGHRSKPAPDSQHTTTESAYLRMTLHHASGHMDGEVKLGPQKGRFLSELRLTELFALLAEVEDYDSRRLLETYLDHHHPEWRRGDSGTSSQRPSDMTRNEAHEALGLAEGASRDDILAAHRRLIQRLHPDRGGSTYLAALLNRARDILLDG